jgi:putative Ca2+/H+ antiporter (TMEM165/GDT1 family)
MLESIGSSFALVALSEMGDKTQLLAFSLAVRFKRPWPILGGILVATLFNHALAAAFGSWLSGALSGHWAQILVGLSFIVFGFWTLKPDSLDAGVSDTKFGVFWTTAFLFFMAEMGDKTQLATVALGARFSSAAAVTAGTTLGMMVSDGLAVFLGEKGAGKLPMKYVRWAAAGLFFLFGLWSLSVALFR